MSKFRLGNDNDWERKGVEVSVMRAPVRGRPLRASEPASEVVPFSFFFSLVLFSVSFLFCLASLLLLV